MKTLKYITLNVQNFKYKSKFITSDFPEDLKKLEKWDKIEMKIMKNSFQ